MIKKLGLSSEGSAFFSGHLWGAGLVFAGAFAFSTKAIFVKLAYQHAVDPVSLLAWRMLFSLPFFLAVAWFSHRSGAAGLQRRDWFWIAGLGILGYYLASLLDFWGLQYISASLERLILYAYPSIVLIISYIWFKKPISRPQYWALGLTYLGIGLAFWGDWSAKEIDLVWQGGLLVFGSAIFYALYLVGSGRMIPRVGSLRFNAYAMTSASAGVILHAIFVNEAALFNLPGEVYRLSLGMALLSTVAASFMLSAGVGRIGAGNASIISSV
ncbi:MAG: DMT family transporter, partial [Bacteroidia bacterium]|nr:DMT family transporter [Bacteroidia bacterium]